MEESDRSKDLHDRDVLEQTFQAMDGTEDSSQQNVNNKDMVIGESEKYKQPLLLPTSLRKHLRQNLTMIALVYCVCMVIACGFLIALNVNGVAAGYGNDGGGGRSFLMPLLWSFIVTISLLFVCCLVYIFTKKRTKKFDS